MRKEIYIRVGLRGRLRLRLILLHASLYSPIWWQLRAKNFLNISKLIR